jgi:5'-3' exonuclease
MQPLLDADVLRYEVGFAVEASWRYMHAERGEEVVDPPPFEMALEILENRISNICAVVGATQPPICFFTGNTNFREHIAKRRKYKDRAGNRPYHYYNITAYIKGKYEWREVEGLEADDLMAIEQTKRRNETIICSRDKDLKQVPGWHYGWEVGNQPQFGPIEVDDLGWLELKGSALKGAGSLYFFSQVLTGDPTDTIPGLPKFGGARAYNLLKDCSSYEEAESKVFEMYHAVFGERAEEEMLEQGQLLWMVRTLIDNQPEMWRLSYQ